ncbi:MAG TPA: DinB family protein [Gemmatimonadaceae bacterium]|jgi:uncharacterized damage-inducible protein DinB
MTIAFDFNDLLAYTDWEREQWYAWFREQGADVLARDLGPNTTGRIQTIGELIRHIFSAEKRYCERARKETLSDTSTIPADDVEALFAFGNESRRCMRELLAGFDDWHTPREMVIGPNTRLFNSRKMILQAVTHEIRHWAQIATILRQAGYKVGPRDLLFSPLFESTAATPALK